MVGKKISLRSQIGLNGANFFLAEMVGVILPFLAVFLQQHQWKYDQIGIAVAVGGLGTFLFQIFAGLIADRVNNKRLLLAASSLVLGISYGLIPLIVDKVFLVYCCVVIAGAANTFFVPLLACLALMIAGHKDFDRLMGVNQSWNHVGNIAAALLALLMVKIYGVASIFYVVFLVSLLASLSIFCISKTELEASHNQEKTSVNENWNVFVKNFYQLLKNKTVQILILTVMLFHFANAPIMPLVGLYLKHLGGDNSQVAWVVFVAQIVMVPIALLTAHFCQSKGRKWVFSIAFIVLPIRIILYTLTQNPNLILAIQILDGVGAGIYGVVICLICGDLTRGKEGFNTLLAIMQSALAFGAMVGPLCQGYLTRYMGFNFTFLSFAAIAIIGAVLFILKMPETKTKN